MSVPGKKIFYIKTMQHTKTQELQLFCIKYSVEFPDFILEPGINGSMRYVVSWYSSSVTTIQGDYTSNPLEALYSALDNTSQWVSREENFLNLMLIHKEYKRKYYCFNTIS
jgi:hypothetical protein